MINNKKSSILVFLLAPLAFLISSMLKAVIEQSGVALPQYYTRDYSIPTGAYSDHAPVIYGDILTWNITQKGEAKYRGG